MNILYNNSICNSSFLGYHPKFTKEEEQNILSTFFEQLLLFDCIVISTDKDNFSLTFLILKLGLETVEDLLEAVMLSFQLNLR